MIPLDEQIDAGPSRGSGNDRHFKPIPSNGVCSLLSDKWTVPVLWRLSLAEDNRLRFSALRREVSEITQRMLTLTLRNLEREGFVVRHYFPEVPPRVEYELTEIGHGALRALEEFNLWVHDNLDIIRARQRAYDQAEL
ncbi:winged helix-turn-helix transcriptional regulator [Agrobacterium tumefaciens]|uniref:winged helix-turn-helix transcriptional regulator n=1 Tax=Agrobacterium tumefaciens TaxID=358 RepID=UPI000DD7F65A|nr:helix-turn-helix domain-containing protein [Agrobacterium tumefaciens]UXS26699.1 helix-turn-helix transcriptional regulator [Agrobacterium tumefaciens]UXS54803.1 helix-turn-helix transcriptional regulator [Agrobacterium tumefaciens]UXS65226.1 helix-turn-helix transcriptional regulator [Agrobacterium tumefaciens]UXT99262.1 helix-turn-helix transcriptional regulator [Agrobacterium tumefaciens]